MNRLHLVAAASGWLSLAPVLWCLRRGVRGTSLLGAWTWLVAAWVVWGAAIWASNASDWPAGTIDIAWYSAAVAMLVPPIAVLGARRPIDRVWSWFVLLPLLLVFAWPALSAFGEGNSPRIWNLEEPMLAGYCLVAVMGAGNYVGLRFTLPALLWLSALAMLVGPLCPGTTRWLPGAEAARSWSALFISAAAWLASSRATRRTDELEIPNNFRLNRVWLGFRDLFGIVWARRVQERFNDEMHRRNLPDRLGIDGLEIAFEESSAARPNDSDHKAAEDALRWLLQKFVDPEWIEARVAPVHGKS